MEGGRRNKKRKKGNEDRISSLPDTILQQIISLINTKTAVQTCILSKRWRYVWTSLPNLDFDDIVFSNYPACWERFRNFVNQVLALRDNSNVYKFRLSGYRVDPGLVEDCLRYAIRHNVQQLDLFANCHPKPFEFPECFFACESLRVLKLTYDHGYRLPSESFCLPGLKTLHLEGFPFKDSVREGFEYSFTYTGKLFSCFPNLESLALGTCFLSNVNICASQLRNLEVLSERYHDYPSESKLIVSAPKLTSFKFEGPFSLICSLEDLPCLEKVYIDLQPRFTEPYPDYIKEKLPRNLIKMLGQLRNAKSITLSLKTAEVLAMGPGSLNSHPSPFRNLKHLKLIAPRGHTTRALPLNVITYLIKGSSCCDDVVVEFPKKESSSISSTFLLKREMRGMLMLLCK